MATLVPGTEPALVAALQRGDVAQETWLGVLNRIGTFESRATLSLEAQLGSP